MSVSLSKIKKKSVICNILCDFLEEVRWRSPSAAGDGTGERGYPRPGPAWERQIGHNKKRLIVGLPLSVLGTPVCSRPTRCLGYREQGRRLGWSRNR